MMNLINLGLRGYELNRDAMIHFNCSPSRSDDRRGYVIRVIYVNALFKIIVRKMGNYIYICDFFNKRICIKNDDECQGN